MAELQLVVRPRHETGKGAARRLRRAGWVPGSLFGALGSIPVQVARKDLEQLLRQEGARTRLVRLKVENGAPEAGQEHPVLIKEIQVHPVTDEWLHVDFYAVRADKPVHARVPLLFEGVEELQRRGLVPAVHVREVEVECLPAAIPPYVAVDVGHLEAGHHIAAGGLSLPEGVKLLTDPDEVVVSVVAPRAAAEEEAEAQAAPATPAEPERVTRRKAAEEEAEE